MPRPLQREETNSTPLMATTGTRGKGTGLKIHGDYNHQTRGVKRSTESNFDMYKPFFTVLSTPYLTFKLSVLVGGILQEGPNKHRRGKRSEYTIRISPDAVQEFHKERILNGLPTFLLFS